MDAFKQARSRVLDVAKGWKSIEEDEGEELRNGRGRRRRAKRKVEEAGFDDDDIDAGIASENGEKDGGKQTRPRTRSQRAKARAKEKDEDVSQEIDGYLSDADMYMDGSRDTRGSRNDDDDEWRNADHSLRDKNTRSAQETSPRLVSCPICNRRMKFEAVEPHLDKCIADKSNPTQSMQPSTPSLSLSSPHIPSPSQHDQQRQRQLPSRSSNILLSTSITSKASSKQSPPLPSQAQSRLAQLNHSLLRDRQLRQKLSELGIPDWGTRALLIRRHTEWVNLHNANCDALRPRSKRELLKDLDVWERTLGGLAPAATNTAAGNAGGGDEGTTVINGKGSAAAVMRKDFDGKGWARKNRNEFDELIAVARQSRESKDAAVSDGDDNVNKASDAGANADADTDTTVPNMTAVSTCSASSPAIPVHTSTSATYPSPTQTKPTANGPIPITIESDNESSAEDHPPPSRLESSAAATTVDATPVKSDILQQHGYKDNTLEVNGSVT